MKEIYRQLLANNITRALTVIICVVTLVIFLQLIRTQNAFSDSDSVYTQAQSFCIDIGVKSREFYRDNGYFPMNLADIDVSDLDVPPLVLYPFQQEFAGMADGPYCVYKEPDTMIKEFVFYNLKNDSMQTIIMR